VLADWPDIVVVVAVVVVDIAIVEVHVPRVVIGIGGINALYVTSDFVLQSSSKGRGLYFPNPLFLTFLVKNSGDIFLPALGLF
jgi:hypothetical protein